MFSIRLRQTKNLMWAHRIITQHRTNGVPTGKTYSLQLYFSDKKNDTLTIGQSKKGHEEIFELLMAKVPMVIYGYIDDLKAMYTKKFSAFLEIWEEHKAGLQSIEQTEQERETIHEKDEIDNDEAIATNESNPEENKIETIEE